MTTDRIDALQREGQAHGDMSGKGCEMIVESRDVSEANAESLDTSLDSHNATHGL